MIHSKLCSQGGLARRIEQVSAMNPSCWWPTLRATWRNGSEPYVESYGLHLEEVKFSQQNFKGKLNPFKKNPWFECCNFSVMYGCRSLRAAPRGDNAVWSPVWPSATGTVARWTVCGFHSRARAPRGGTVQGSWADQPCPRAAGCVWPWREAGVWQVVQWAGGDFLPHSSWNLCCMEFMMFLLLQCHRRPHSGIAAKAVHTGAAGTHNPLL